MSSTLVPLALTASGALTYHNAQHKADSPPSSGNPNFNFRDLKSLQQDNFLTMEEDSLDEASTTGIFPLNSVVQCHGHGTMKEVRWPDIYSEVRESSEPMKSITFSVEENIELEDSQSVLSELSSEERSLSSNRDKSSQYIDFINNNINDKNNNKNKNKKIAPWRVLKPIVLKSFIAITPQII